MVDAVKHGVISSTATTGWETAKGGVVGALAVGIIGALVAATGVGIAVLGGAALIGAIAPGITAAGAVAAMTIPAAIASTVAGIAGGVSSLTGGGLIGGAVGAVVGFINGRSRVAKERATYEEHAAGRRQDALIQGNQIAMVGMQQGYAMGYQQGQQRIVSEIQAMQEQMIREEMAKKGAHASKCSACASKAETILKQREARANAAPQVG